jgi:transposase
MQMGKPIEITRLEFSANELRELAAGMHDGAVVRRLLAIALILDGHSRAEAARLNGMDRQTLRDWVHRYNDEGVGGLSSRLSPGRPAALNGEQMEALRSMVLEGPDPERDTVIRWRCIDLRHAIAARWSVELHERSVGRLLHRLGMTRLQPRPCHPKKNAAAQEAFKKTSPPWRPRHCQLQPQASRLRSGSRCYEGGHARDWWVSNLTHGSHPWRQ